MGRDEARWGRFPVNGLAMQSARLKRVFAVWRDLTPGAKRDGTVEPPPREAFSPHLIAPSDLPFVVLLDVIDGGADFRFRLAGTEVVRVVGFEFTGVRLMDHLHLTEVQDLLDSYRDCVRTAAPVVYAGTLARFDKRFVTYERLTLPLADTDGTVGTILGVVDFGALESS